MEAKGNSEDGGGPNSTHTAAGPADRLLPLWLEEACVGEETTPEKLAKRWSP